MIKQYVLPVMAAAFLGGCSMMDTSSVSVPPVSISGTPQSFHAFSELSCQTMPISPGKSSFKVAVGAGDDQIKLATGDSAVLAYALPETGFHQITVSSSVISEGKGTEEVFIPEVSLLDRSGKVLRTIKASQVQYQKPGFMTDEGVFTTFTIDNRVQNPATCMVIYTSDEARQGETKLLNEAKEYAKVRGTVALPFPDTFAKHGNQGKLTISLKSSQEYVSMPAQSHQLAISSGPVALSKADPFTQKVKEHYLKTVNENLKNGDISRALDQRSELKEVARATESYFASQYKQTAPAIQKPVSAKNKEDFAGMALHHYQVKIAEYLKAGRASSALKVVDEVRGVQEEVDQLFDRKS